METIEGKIKSFNISPKGFYESFLVASGNHVVQVNFMRDAGPEAASGLKVGQSITLKAEPIEDDRPSSHPVYEWREHSSGTHEGIICQINYARHGEPNGAILETGEFVHMRPEGAKALKLKTGQSLIVEGEAKRSPAGHTVIEARKVNGVAMKAPPPKPKKNHA